MRLDKMKRTVFTKFAPKRYNPERTWYGIIQVGNKNLKVEKVTRFRSDAVEHFRKQAKLQNGELTTVGTY